MKRASIWILACCCGAVLVSCARPRGYEGYKNSPYTVRGQRYYPMSVDEAVDHEDRGTASWYDESSFFGLKRGTTALGEKVLPWHMIGAHKTLPLPCQVKVTNLENGRKVKLRINDRGPYIAGRMLDVSSRAAKKLGFRDDGLTEVHIRVLSVGDGKWKRKGKRRWFGR